MRLSRLLNLGLKLLAAVLEAIISYMVYLLVNNFWFTNRAGIGLGNIVSVSLLSVSFTYLTGRLKIKKNIRDYSVVAAGLLIILAFAAWKASGLNPTSLGMSIILLAFLWVRGIWYSVAENKELYTLAQFYTGMAVLLATNAFSLLLQELHEFIPIISQCTVFVALTGIFLLTRCKSESYTQLENKKRTELADLLLTLGLLLLMLLMSSGRILKWVLFYLAVAAEWLFEIIYKVLLVVGYVLNMIFMWFITHLREFVGIFSTGGGPPQEIENYLEYAEKPWMNMVARVAAYCVIILCVVLVFVYIKTLLDKVLRKGTGDEYTEGREFLIKTESIRDGVLKGLGSMGKGIVKAIGLLGKLKLSNREKIRHEYRNLLILLYEKGIAGRNDTAERLDNILSHKYPEVQTNIRSATDIYKRVRYGAHEPDDEQVKVFKVHTQAIRAGILR
ncbi:MAG: DUF4129 domain-containing protein [Caulobacteraceae bacterium]